MKTPLELAIEASGLNAPRVTPEHIDSLIKGATYTRLPSGKTMVCEITLANGFTVTGKSSVVSPANFSESFGRRISYEKARNKIWELEGYVLQSKHAIE